MEKTIRWTGSDETEVVVTDEFDVEREVDRTETEDIEAAVTTESEPVQDEGTAVDE